MYRKLLTESSYRSSRPQQDQESREHAFREELNDLLSTTSHELRNSLNGVLGMLNLALLQKDLDTKDEYLRIAHQAGEHIVLLLNGLQDLSRIGLDQHCHREMVAMRPFLEDLITTYRPSAESKGLNLELSLDPGLENHLFLNAHGTRRILENLITNALKFTVQGSIICRAAPGQADPGGTVEVSVIDTGPGIRPDLMDHIFERFYRAPEARQAQVQGTGLGLTIARELARSLGGDLHAKSDGKSGSEFCFWFPV
ncbi:MAG: hypothetical protein CMN76_20585 [Spirochaetaceae bacterium]|nr:hypothetical protein [Spirochaetaceae bacterium]|tara:strand:+ start:14638 stop:15402 length:765 start_codon:yes stop_codon:yes gene_type:complete